MKSKSLILLSSAVIIALLCSLALVKPVHAVPPIPYYIDYGVGPVEYIDCGDFQISHIWTAFEEGITHLDKDGHWVHSNVVVHWSIHYWREGTNLEAFNDTHWSGGYTWDDEGNMVTAFGHGKIMLIHVPGYGAIVREAGYIYLNYITGEWIDHGQNRDFTHAEYQALCSYFNGE